MHKKKGDTLVEVALAVGIFSMVAIAVVSVVSASTSGAQSALETTLTREEIDSQAEALRFIHDSYVNDLQSEKTTDNKYATLWQAITKNSATGALSYNPTTCDELYNGSGAINTSLSYNQGSSGSAAVPFVINTRMLNNFTDPTKVVIRSGTANVFYAPATYPRILYGASTATTEESLIDQTAITPEQIARVEGFYIVATKGSHNIISGDGSTFAQSNTAYYDFYIRSCWMPTGKTRASTISTVIRLYDPAVIVY